jgi:hypothetical protein
MKENFENEYFEKVNKWVETNNYIGTCNVFNTFFFKTNEDCQKAITILVKENNYFKSYEDVLENYEGYPVNEYLFWVDVMKTLVPLTIEDIKTHIAFTLGLLKDFDFENNSFAVVFEKSETESDYFNPFE